ncbi:MAG: chemotaxis protein [Gammaproteobacteria bacterium]|nr:chemotaxis protein [Gammaproteobacteria bacterium]
MAGFIASVDTRTQLAGQNRMELLLFRLSGKQCFGINVFKVREVIQCPPLTVIPKAHPVIRGMAHIRGTTMSVMDLSFSIGLRAMNMDEQKSSFLIITEYNNNMQGFLVSAVDRIVNQSWKDILPLPKGGINSSYLTAVTKIDGEMIEIIDVERVLSEVIGTDESLSDKYIQSDCLDHCEKKLILIVDDSVVARNQIKRTVEQIGCETVLALDGEEALTLLSGWASNADPEFERLAMIISDIEMPKMDGYTLTRNIRKNDDLKHLKVILHTSLSGGFNQSMVSKVGADEFISKFSSDALAKSIIKNMKALQEMS